MIHRRVWEEAAISAKKRSPRESPRALASLGPPGDELPVGVISRKPVDAGGSSRRTPSPMHLQSHCQCRSIQRQQPKASGSTGA